MNQNLWNNILIQEGAKKALEKIYFRNAYPPALIFLGPNGVGKEAHAFAFAQSINCESKNFEPCGVCPRCNRIANLLFPDVYYLYPLPTGSSEKISTIKKIEILLEKKK